MLGLTPDMYADTIVDYDITPVVCASENAAAFVAAAKAKGKTVHALIAVDTGMGRIGYLADDLDFAVEDVKKIAALENFKIKGMFFRICLQQMRSTRPYSHQQEAKNTASSETLTAAGIEIPFRTLANSAPSWNFRLYTSMHAAGHYHPLDATFR